MTSKRNRNAMPYAVVNFTGLMLICDESASKVCRLHGVASSLYFIQLDFSIDLFKQLASSLWLKDLDNQLALRLLTTCN